MLFSGWASVILSGSTEDINGADICFKGDLIVLLIENDRYFTIMCVYIYGDPLRAGIVKR